MKYALAAAMLVPLAASASSFERFDAPGAQLTCGSAVASNGLVAGVSLASAVGVDDAMKARPAVLGAFLYRSGRFFQQKPAVPAGMISYTGVNRWAAITGLDIDSAQLTSQSFVFSRGTTSFPTVPLGAVLTLDAINDAGTLLGQASVGGGPLTLPRTVGFLKTAGGTVTPIDDGSGFVDPAGMDATASNVVGMSFTQSLGGWLFHDGVFTPVNVPGASVTSPRGVTTGRVVTGTYLVGSGPAAVAHGFRLRNGIYTTLDVPGAEETSIGGMNEAGQLTGCFERGGRLHGFLYTP